MSKTTVKSRLVLIPVEDAAKRLGFHHRTIRRMVVDGRLKGYRVAGWALRVDQNEVDALIELVPAAGQ